MTVQLAKSEVKDRKPNPLNVAYDLKRSESDARIESLKARLEALRTGEDTASGSNKGEWSRITEELRSLRQKSKALRDSANTIRTELDGYRKQMSEKQSEITSQKDKLPFKSTSEIDSRVATMESKVETGSFSLTEEKQILQEISKLKKNRKTLEILESGGSLDGGRSPLDGMGSLKMKEEVLKAKMTVVYSDLDVLKPKIQVLEEQLTKLEGGRDAVQAKQKQRQKEIDRLRKDLDSEYTLRKDAYEEHQAAKSKQKEAWDRNRSRREEEFKRREIEDEIYELEKKMEHLNPAASVDKHISECVNLTNYFSALLPVEQPEQCKEKKSVEVVDGDYVVLKPKSERTELYCATGPCANGHAASNKKKSTGLGKLPIQILAALADLQLPVPSTPSDLHPLLTRLSEKKAVFNEQRDQALAGVKKQEDELKTEIAKLSAKLESGASVVVDAPIAN